MHLLLGKTLLVIKELLVIIWVGDKQALNDLVENFVLFVKFTFNYFHSVTALSFIQFSFYYFHSVTVLLFVIILCSRQFLLRINQ